MKQKENRERKYSYTGIIPLSRKSVVEIALVAVFLIIFSRLELSVECTLFRKRISFDHNRSLYCGHIRVNFNAKSLIGKLWEYTCNPEEVAATFEEEVDSG